MKGTFSINNRLEFETYCAKDAVVSDFNKDGLNDIFFSNHMYAHTEERFGNRMIDSYLYYGTAKGFLKEKRARIQTIGAWDACAADLNKDGWVDLLVCSSQEHYSYEVPSFIYWNGPNGFDITKRTPLYEHGAEGCAIADFNGDGHQDILITCMMGDSRGGYDPSFLYFGSKSGNYSVSNRIELPAREPYEQGMADLNDDGQVDILVPNMGETQRYENEVWIYWNKDNKFDPWYITGLPGHGIGGVEIADLDRDGYLDVVVANAREFLSASGLIPRSFIYWGDASGYVVTKRTELPIAKSRSPSIADLNNDGHLDLIFSGPDPSVFWGDGTRNYGDHQRNRFEGMSKESPEPEIADLNKDGILDVIFAGEKTMSYYGASNTFYPVSNRLVLNVSSKSITAADINKDGRLDLVCPLYKAGGKRSLRSRILQGGPDGFNEDRCISLPTDGGTGSIVSDFNFDGYPDVFFFCHRKDGDSDVVGQFADHHTDSRLYWGGSKGFRDDNFLAIPSVGVHYDVGVDLGRLTDRTFSYEYISSGHAHSAAKPLRMSWDARTPGKTSIKFQVRAATTEAGLKTAPWIGSKGERSWFIHSGDRIGHLPQDGWIQYRAVLDTFNGAASPVLSAVQIDFQ